MRQYHYPDAMRDLSTDGIAMIRPFSRPIRNFQVFGERSSGTNFVSHIVNQHLGLVRNKSYGWKHGFPAMSAISPRSLIIVLFRNALPWVRSMYNKPWHTTGALQQLEFSEFIRSEWRSHIKGGINSKDEPVDPRIWKSLQLDRDPLTGLPFANIVQLRNTKTLGFLSFANRRCNVVFARHETVADNPQAFLDRIADHFDISPASPYEPFDRVTGGGRWARIRPVKAPKELSSADHGFVLSQLNVDVERFIGYEYALAAQKNTPAQQVA
jgi:hypothetical protein